MASIRAFENFDWGASDAWLQYYKNLFPTPTYQQLARIKQRWYKKNIDSSFDPEASSEPSSQPSSQPSSSSSQRQYNAPSPSTLQLVQIILFLLAFPAFFINKSLHLIIAGHFAGIIHYHNVPRLSADYWRNVILDDNMHSILFALIFLFFHNHFLWVVPAFLGTFVYIGDVLSRHPSVPGSIKVYTRRLDANKVNMLQVRADAEMWIGFASILMIFLGGNIIFPLIYWQYTRMRYMLNGFSKTSFAYLRLKGDTVFQRMPAIVQKGWEKVKSICAWSVSMEAGPSAGSSCTVF